MLTPSVSKACGGRGWSCRGEGEGEGGCVVMVVGGGGGGRWCVECEREGV